MAHLNRFFCRDLRSYETKSEITLSAGNAHHIRDVLRISRGSCIKLFNGLGTECLVSLIEVSDKAVRGNIVEVSFVKNSVPCIILGQAIPRHRKIDLIIQKATELGVHRIIPFYSKRTAVKVNGSYKAGKLKRWRKIVEEAASQCGRSYLPFVSDVTSVEGFCSSCSGSSIKLMLWEDKSPRLRDIISDNLTDKVLDNIALMIGPEGGFDAEEVEYARNLGFFTVSLGETILRTETASLCVLSILQYVLGNIG